MFKKTRLQWKEQDNPDGCLHF